MIKVCSIAVATQTVLDCKTTVKDEQIKSGERERGHVTVEQSVPSSHNSQQVVSWSTPTPRHPLMSVYLETLVLYSPNLAHASTLQQQWGRDKEKEVSEWVSVRSWPLMLHACSCSNPSVSSSSLHCTMFNSWENVYCTCDTIWQEILVKCCLLKYEKGQHK